MKREKVLWASAVMVMLVLAACGPNAAPGVPASPVQAGQEITTNKTGTGQAPLEAPNTPAETVNPPVNQGNVQKAPPYDPNGLPFGINSTQTPAPLKLSNFTVTPRGLRLFETANASVVVTNTGSAPVSYAVTLHIRMASGREGGNIRPSNTQTIDLAGGESKTVNFTFTGLGNGSHVVYIDQLWDRVSVDSQV